MSMKGARVKSVYGKPWSKLASGGIVVTREVLEQLGQAIVDAVVLEGRKDVAREGKPARGRPEGIPDSKRFFESFGYRISGKSTIEVTCSWPYIEQITEGRGPAPMTKLTLARGGDVVPIKTGPSTVIFRIVPPTLTNAWIHPGFSKHNFIKRGIAKGREDMMEVLVHEAQKQLSAGDPFR